MRNIALGILACRLQGGCVIAAGLVFNDDVILRELLVHTLLHICHFVILGRGIDDDGLLTAGTARKGRDTGGKQRTHHDKCAAKFT